MPDYLVREQPIAQVPGFAQEAEMSHLQDVITAMHGRKVVVIGEAILDSYSNGTVSRICPEAPVPVVTVDTHTDAPGGAANLAANAAALGADVTLLSVVGADEQARTLADSLLRCGVDPGGLVLSLARETLSKHRIAASGQMLVRHDRGTTTALSYDEENQLIAALEAHIPTVEVVMVSDYSYGVLTERVRDAIQTLRRAHGTALFVDSRRLTWYRALSPTIVKPNFVETCKLVGEAAARAIRESADPAAAQAVLEATGAELALITNDSDGAVIVRNGSAPCQVAAGHSGQAFPAGAGDTFGATFTLAHVSGATHSIAGELASTAAAIVVGEDGTSTCSADRLRAALASPRKVCSSVAALRPALSRYAAEGRRVVFTNGVFDLLHAGHISYLDRSRQLGDVLIVGLNSDASARALKGRGRPVNSLEERARVLAALDCVDHVVPFEGLTACDLIREVRPAIFTKGGNQDESNLPEAPLVRQLGGVVRILPLIEHESTTAIIQRILAAGSSRRRRGRTPRTSGSTA
jgi:D-beta-D-heptose 7-phosphate kinase/D-beta-D-heptose 1-phosphate adenosyltransferase